MSAYAATARIERVTPRLVIGRAGIDLRAASEPAEEDLVIDLATPRGDPMLERLTAIRERWSQLTFYLFDPQSWR
jgi:hypothetical protein